MGVYAYYAPGQVKMLNRIPDYLEHEKCRNPECSKVIPEWKPINAQFCCSKCRNRAKTIKSKEKASV